MGGIAGVVLAAGAGSRLGGVEKAILRLGGRSFLEGVAMGMRASVHPIVVVMAPTSNATRDHAAELGLDIAINPDPDRGPLSSLAAGLASFAIDPAVEAALVAPVDQARLQPATVAALITRYRAAPGLFVASHAGRRGHPVILPRSLWLAIEEPGPATTLRDITHSATPVDVADPSVLWNINTQAVLDRLEKEVAHA